MIVDQAPDQFPARRILVGVAGSIASLTVPQSILWLRHGLGIEVRTVMTRQAATMVTPRAIAVTSGHPVALDDGRPENDPAVPHLDLTRWADLLLVLPATANILAKAAQGTADDLLSTCILAAECPVVFVPSMNEVMWRKPAVQRNVATLEADGYGVIAPVEGLAVADGQGTVGAMPDIDVILERARPFLQRSADRFAPGGRLPGSNGAAREGVVR
jgi:phosphopantothenoylcysteine decarboxylase/phosphopantothenate--cysteine ligase